MAPAGSRWLCCLFPLLIGQIGCSTISPAEPRVEITPAPSAPSVRVQRTPNVITPFSPSDDRVESTTRQVQFVIEQDGPPETAVPANVFADVKELTPESLVDQVLARNPTIAQMTAAASAAAARYPQVTSLDDPMFGGTIGPASIGSRSVDFAWRVEVSQRLPYPGKRSLRGASADAEARAATDDVEDTRLQLAESARTAFYDYFLSERALEVNRTGLELLQEFRKDAQSRYKTGTAPEQDYLLADVEIGRQRERQVALERAREVAIARINTLMHLPPDAKLPLPPRSLTLGSVAQDAIALRKLAVARRPDLRAVVSRLEAERAALALAEREYKPDFEAMAAYDSFWQPSERDVRPMIGLRMNLPVRYARRAGAVGEAAAKVAQRRAEYDRLIDQINYDVQQAFAQLRESERAAQLYEKTILPAARENVRAAQAGYAATKVPALSVIEAQRNLITQRERAYEIMADFFRRRAALERAIGGPLPAASREQLPPPKDPSNP